MNDTLLQLAGRLHPMVLHLPIGVLGAAVAVELWGRLRGRPLERGARLVLAWLLVLTAAMSITSGLLLSEEPGYVDDVIVLHKWLGIVTGAALLVAAIFATFRYERGYLAVLLTAGVLIVPTGHFGAGMTHGRNFLTAPFAAPAAKTASDTAADPARGASWYASEIAPILDAHCTTCHGPTRRKGDLALDTADAIRAGGGSGSVLAAADGGAGEIVRRIGLPLADDDHMPPDGKPQLSEAQIDTLARWVAAGAPFDAPTPGAEAVVAQPPVAAEPIPCDPPADAVAALRAAHVHVEVIDPALNGLWVDFIAVRDLAIEEIVRLLAPVAACTTELSLRGVTSADEVLTRCAPWEALRRLDLSDTNVDEPGLVAAAAGGGLVELTLVGTSLSPEAAETLAGLDSVERLHVWGADVPPATLATLRQRDGLDLNEGGVDVPPPVEVEPAFDFGKPKVAAASLAPVNSACPVTGAPVDARFAIVHEDQVIAFCCNVCPGKFWDDPGAFPVKAITATAGEPSANERALFDGNSLDGWHASGGGTWSVEDGIIVGRSSADVAEHGLLVSDRTYGDFELTFEYRVLDGDSGFYFRADEAAGALGVAGFQVEVDDVEPGGLYETAGRGWVVKPTPEEAAAWHRTGEWNAVKLVAVGPDLTVTINGQQTARLDDPDGRTEGVLAMQLHGGQEMHVQYRDIRLRER